MQAEVHLRLAREHPEAAETQLAPAEAPSMSTVKTFAGEFRPVLLLMGKAAPRNSCGRCITTGSQC